MLHWAFNKVGEIFLEAFITINEIKFCYKNCIDSVLKNTELIENGNSIQNTQR